MLLTISFVVAMVTVATGNSMDVAPYKQLLLDEHSRYRSMQKGSNMNKLEWDDQLAKEADDWIKSCSFEHQQKGRGENLAFATGDNYEEMTKSAMKGWYDEINTYSYTGKACMSSCHYTQMVWAQTRKVGCAMNKCSSLSAFGQQIKDAWYLACYYDPMGNDMSEYPYLKGKECSACLEGQGCDDGLCTGKGKQICDDKDENCEYWETIGECTNNEPWMKKTCRKSCHFCDTDDVQVAAKPCEDLKGSAQCGKWKFSCESNKAFMKKQCKKTCGIC